MRWSVTRVALWRMKIWSHLPFNIDSAISTHRLLGLIRTEIMTKFNWLIVVIVVVICCQWVFFFSVSFLVSFFVSFSSSGFVLDVWVSVIRTVVCVLLSSYIWLSMCATLCSLIRCILFSVFYVLPFGVINDDDDDDRGVYHQISVHVNQPVICSPYTLVYIGYHIVPYGIVICEPW